MVTLKFARTKTYISEALIYKASRAGLVTLKLSVTGGGYTQMKERPGTLEIKGLRGMEGRQEQGVPVSDIVLAFTL